MTERLGANGMPMREREESNEMLSEILEVNPNKKKKKTVKKDYEWSSEDKENGNEEL
tara:strand:- start:10362 stop:10532 length:171 start_codon:yes stop_codon:yes gene_type:complete